MTGILMWKSQKRVYVFTCVCVGVCAYPNEMAGRSGVTR